MRNFRKEWTMQNRYKIRINNCSETVYLCLGKSKNWNKKSLPSNLTFKLSSWSISIIFQAKIGFGSLVFSEEETQDWKTLNNWERNFWIIANLLFESTEKIQNRNLIERIQLLLLANYRCLRKISIRSYRSKSKTENW